MKLTRRVKEILSWYESDNPGTKANLARILMEGKLGGTGRMVILPVDQGFEHGPARSFAPNPAAYDPHYHFELAIEAGLNAYAAPLGMIEAGAATFAGAIPTILKVNSSNSLSTTKDQAVTGSVADALRLGCSAIGFTIYPSSEYQFEMMEELRELAEEAKSAGLAVVVWSYPRGPMLDKTGETAYDICAYAAHMAALLGAHIIKVKPPTDALSLDAAKKVYIDRKIDGSDPRRRRQRLDRRPQRLPAAEGRCAEAAGLDDRGLQDQGLIRFRRVRRRRGGCPAAAFSFAPDQSAGGWRLAATFSRQWRCSAATSPSVSNGMASRS